MTVSESEDLKNKEELKSTKEIPTGEQPFFSRQKQGWKNHVIHDDSLASCLELLCQHHGVSVSRSSITSGLPLENGRLDPELFLRAAERAGFSAQIVRKQLKDISKLVLPCVLILQGGKACLLMSRPSSEEFELIFPETGTGARIILGEDLEQFYDGFAIFAQPVYKYDSRSIEIEVTPPREWFWGTLSKFWPTYSQVIGSAILVNIFTIASTIFVMNVYDRVVPNNAIETLWVMAAGIGIVYIFDFILKMLRVHFVDDAGGKADLIISSRLFQHVMGLKLAARPASSGGFANQLREFETIRDFFSSATVVTLVDLPFVFLFIAIITYIGGAVAYVPLIATPLIIIGTLLVQGPLEQWVRKSFREGAQKHALLIESLNGLETVKAFNAESRMQNKWERFIQQSSESSKSAKLLSAIAINFSGFIQQLSYIAMIIVGVYLIANGSLSMGGLIACSILGSRALSPLSSVVGLMTRLNQTKTALEALDKLIKLPVERPEGATFLHRPHIKGDIELKDVVFSYPTQKTRALNGLNLKIAAGEHIGLVGRIGSGKSTIEKLILNLYSPETGSVSVDSTDLRQIDPSDIRSKTGYVPQEVYLFYGTVRENILFGAETASPEQLFKAVELSGVIDFTRTHPQGLDMPVGEGGSNLSGGQRQAIAIARALIRDPQILILDEPTSHMDNASEARLIMRLEPFIQGKTVILISHRMPVLRLATRLAIIEQGRVIADGPRDEVVKALMNSQIQPAGA